MGFGAAMGEVVEQGTGGTTGIVGSQMLEHGPLKSFHQFLVGIFFFQPVQGQTQQRVEGLQIRIWFGGLFDGLGKVGGGKDPGVRLAQTGSRAGEAGFAKMMEGGSPGGFPADFTFVKKIEMTPHRVAGLGRPLGECADNAMVPG